MRTRVAVVVGTRPEAIKLAPVVHELRNEPDADVVVISTGQHRELATDALALFAIRPDRELKIGQPGHSPTDLLAMGTAELGGYLADDQFDWILVQGDTTTALAGALAGMAHDVPVAHLEAGLRSGDVSQPFPEEHHRKAITAISRLHLAPTPGALQHLMAEGIDEAAALVVGNTVIDALWWMRHRLDGSELDELGLPAGRVPVLLTAHRRETQGGPMRRALDAVAEVAAARVDEICVVVPVHPNPAVAEVVTDRLVGAPGVKLLEPLDYRHMVALLCRCRFVVTDSGGLQEEAPALGVPVLVLRETTERPEGISGGGVQLVGTDPSALQAGMNRLLDAPPAPGLGNPRPSPYGDGFASARVADALLGRPVEPFIPE
ncbi:MAG: UDP-N-acetylglucosamine 2-epimerase (non-hydrolyzing) [Microthrixaceae bacterium]